MNCGRVSVGNEWNQGNPSVAGRKLGLMDSVWSRALPRTHAHAPSPSGIGASRRVAPRVSGPARADNLNQDKERRRNKGEEEEGQMSRVHSQRQHRPRFQGAHVPSGGGHNETWPRCHRFDIRTSFTRPQSPQRAQHTPPRPPISSLPRIHRRNQIKSTSAISTARGNIPIVCLRTNLSKRGRQAYSVVPDPPQLRHTSSPSPNLILITELAPSLHQARRSRHPSLFPTRP